jgi:uncharacterized protein
LAFNAALKFKRQNHHHEAAIKPQPESSTKEGVRQTGWGLNMTMTDQVLAEMDPFSATADELFNLGLQYCLGHGVKQSLVAAHKWFNISALKGDERAKTYRCELSQEMTALEIAEAQRQARALITLH